jgi:uncharacterized membrane protein
MSERKEKQERFAAPKKNNILIYALAAIFVVVGVLGVYFVRGGSSKNAAGESAAYNVGAAVTYQNPIEMTDVKNNVADGKVAISLDDVKKNSIIYTEYNQNGKKLELTAWVAPSGNITAAVSVCEPCRGYKFHIDGSDIVCNTCGTRWTLEELKGISGGCLAYPPDKLKYEVKDGKILLDEAQIQAWKPRV